jgi:phage FluMu gp28-like protein
LELAVKHSGYFLPYQVKWINDNSRFKIVEKSRRVGMTYAQSYEDVRDAARQDGMDVWFSSADESAAAEYILYCQQWAKLFDAAAEYLGEVVIDSEKDIKALSIKFSSGYRVNALSSNPKAFRSKGGKLVLDEFAFHKQPEEMWKAAIPIITWGYPVRVLSTYNGQGNRYFRMVTDAKNQSNVSGSKSGRWSLHTTTIEMAVEQGLVDKILGRPSTDQDKTDFIEDCRAAAGDEETYQQEYMCVPVDEASAWLTWDLITSAEHEEAGKPEFYKGGDCYVGVDIGRRHDLFVCWVDEKIGDVFWNREVIKLKNASFAEQDAALDRVFDYYKVRRACMDQTGIGEKPVEDAKTRHGTYKVEGILFTGPVKQHLATIIKQVYEDKKTRTPVDKAIRESHHAVRKLTTIAGNPRFDADRTEVGHADEFWAHALAVHAAEGTVQPAAGESVEAESDLYTSSRYSNRQHTQMFKRTRTR